MDIETWPGNPGQDSRDFQQYNTIFFGDTLFSEEQLRFQNIAKNKDMFDILDISEIDKSYYGLFKDDSQEILDRNLGYDIYTVFKTNPAGIVQKLPYEIVNPRLYKTADDVYSLYVVEHVLDGTDSDGKSRYRLQLREISVPDSPIYAHRTIPIQDIMGREVGSDMSGLAIYELVMSSFRPGDTRSSFFVLDNHQDGFHKIQCKNIIA